MSQPEQIRQSRLRFDWNVCQRMFNQPPAEDLARIIVAAYRTTSDLQQQINPITSADEAHLATRYRALYHVPTLLGPGNFTPVTEIGFDLATGNYPFSEPATWIISSHVPYSPHFRQHAPVCLGELWPEAKGRMLLGQLIVHVARLLNWDEVARGGGYRGWNGQAIDYVARQHKGGPLNRRLRYPVLPVDFTHGVGAGPTTLSAVDQGPRRLTDLFAVTGGGPVMPSGLFTPNGPAGDPSGLVDAGAAGGS
jgi:hypothetical protein